MKVENIINNNGNRAANQFVISNGNKVYFQSYATMIALWDYTERKLYVTPSWDCSVTTRKHFYIFLNEYTSIDGNRESVLNGIREGRIEVVQEKMLSL